MLRIAVKSKQSYSRTGINHVNFKKKHISYIVEIKKSNVNFFFRH